MLIHMENQKQNVTMFSGIIEEFATVVAIRKDRDNIDFTLDLLRGASPLRTIPAHIADTDTDATNKISMAIWNLS